MYIKNVKLRLLFVYTIPCGNTHMAIGHLSTHVPSAMFNDADGGKKGFPQCKAPFHSHIYALFSLQVAMLKHWEYNQCNTPN